MMEAREIANENPFRPAREKFEEVVERLQTNETLVMRHDELESFIDREGREVLRLLLQGHLDLRSPGETLFSVHGADGVERTHRRPGARGLMSIFGPVEVERMGYGQREVETLHPLDAELNLPPES